MPGLVVPSLLDRDMMAAKRTLEQIVDQGQFDQRNVHRLGNGLGISRDGQVVVEKRSMAPTQTENEDMMNMFLKFTAFLKSEGAEQIAQSQGLVEQTQTDPSIIPQPVTSPADLAYEFGTPIDTTEIITLCEETGLYRALPEVVNGSKVEAWREMTAMGLASGTNWISFTAGGCPEFGTSTTGAEKSVTKKHIGQQTTLTESDIQHSIASVAAGYGVRTLLGPISVNGAANIVRESIKSLMDKEIKKQSITVLNGWDFLLVKGDATSRTTEFNGVENYVTSANGARTNVLLGSYSGTFSAARFDEWLSAGISKPTHLFGHPTTLSALLMGYWGLGANSGPAQIVNFPGNAGIVPGLNFAMSIETGIGRLPLVPDSRFSRTDHSNGTFSADIFALRMTHDGEPLVYRGTQIPLSYKELNPGCSAISFITWAVTSLIVKAMVFQSVYRSMFSGLSQDGVSYVFG